MLLSDKPIQSKKHKFQEASKLKKIVSKNVNRAVEEEMRSRASDGKKNFSKAEQAVAANNMAQTSTQST